MKKETLKQRFERKKTIGVYAESAFTGIGIFDYESGIEDFVFFYRQNADGTKKFFKRKIETEFSEDENDVCDVPRFFFRFYGNKYYLSDFLAV
jgi:hypothetical protein